jgi:hypothetical protein
MPSAKRAASSKSGSKRSLHALYRAIYEGTPYNGELVTKTSGGLTKADLVKNKRGVIVSKKRSSTAKKNFKKNSALQRQAKTFKKKVASRRSSGRG